MATYKKRGFKPKKEKINQDFSQEVEETIDVSDSTTAEVFNTLDETASKSEKWIEKNSKLLLAIVGGFLVLFLAYIAYQRFVSEPKEAKASNLLSFPRINYNKARKATDKKVADSLYMAAINGSDGKFGFVDVSTEYSGTRAGNVANYYAGISYLKTKQYEKAIQYLEKFDSNDNVLAPVALGSIGDAFADLNQPEEAIEYYELAAEKSENEFTTPLFLFKAGQLALLNKDFKKAEEFFTTIKEEYSSEKTGVYQDQYKRDIDKFVNMAKYADESAFKDVPVKAQATPKGEVKVEVLEDADALYNATDSSLGKSVKGFEYLGVFTKLKLKDGTELLVLSEGFEKGLVTFIESDADIDKTLWFNLRRILFTTGSANLDARSGSQIDNIVTILNVYSTVELKIGGYTDNVGNADSNKLLSEKRANALLEALVAKGIDRARLRAEGYGVEHPVADNNTEEGRAKNRRVSARVSKK